ncbi:MAG: hypothetical protein ASARMPREDX12_006738 [Alectoria sarmentosa]|nr:MAG: hypothetical protein ASARMPREDX12_006738 [Alectoria sarmentosa]
MLKQGAATILAVVGASEPRRSKRARKATKRFAEGYLCVLLPRLSLALGVGVSNCEDTDQAGVEGGALSSDDNDSSAHGPAPDDKTRTPDAMGEGQEAVVVGASENRRSGRVRKATQRFVEGWLGVNLPSLSSALGVAAPGGQND